MRITLINQFYTPDVSPTAHLCASLAEHRAAMGDEVTVLTSRTGYVSTATTKTAENLKNASAPLAVSQRRQPRHCETASDTNPGTIAIGHVPTERSTGRPITLRRLWSTRFGSRTNLGRLLDWTTFYLPAFRAAATLPRQDVVIALTTPPFIALAGWLHKLIHPSTRLILWNMDVYPEALERTTLVKAGGIVSRIMRSANRAIFRRLDHLITLDGAMADLLLSQYTPPGAPIAHTTIPNWESLAMFPAEETMPPAREKFVVLYLGNAGYGHEFQTLIDAAGQLRDDPVTFLFIGGGALLPWIRRECDSRKLSNIVLREYVPKEQTPRIMREADCALITLENAMLGVMSPSKLHANLAMGLPVIYVGPPGANVDEAIARFACGISLRPGEAQRMAEFIQELIGSRHRLAELRRNARAAFEQAYCDRGALVRFDGVIGSVRIAASSGS